MRHRYLLAVITTAAIACNAGGSNLKDGGGLNGSNGAGGDGNGNLFNTGGSDLSGQGGGCNELTVAFEKQTPTVVLLVDRSGSMFDNAYSSSADRWTALYDALMNSSTGVVNDLQNDVRFGFATYTNNGNDSQGTCPLISEVTAAVGNYDAILSAYDSESTKPNFKAETPTGPAVAAISTSLAAFNEPGPKYILLATDGEPDTCSHPDPQCGQDESIVAVQAAYAQGIGTIVIGIGDEVGAKHLKDLANAGAGLPVEEPDDYFNNTCLNSGISQKNAEYSTIGGGAVYYQPSTQAQLETDIHGIINGVRDCTFELKAKVELDQAYLCEVELDGVPIQHMSDWKLKTETELEVLGDACDQIKTVSKEIHIDCPCEIVTPL